MDVFARFQREVRRPEPEIDLGEAALLIAEAGDPDCDAAAARQALEDFAHGVGDLTSLCRRLFVDLRFEGDTTSYYDPANSFLNRVIERRRGIPISLSVVVIEVGRRSGIELEGIGLPSHFVVRDPASGLYIDAYSARVLDEADLAALYRAANNLAASAPFPPEHRRPMGSLAMLDRMLNNLALIYRSQAQAANVEWVARLRLALPGAAPSEALELARAMAAQGRVLEAAVELENRARIAGRAGRPEDMLAAARALRARLN